MYYFNKGEIKMGYEAMFSPIKIRNVELKNRIAVAPMCTSWCTPNGEISAEQCKYYHNIAKGDPGLVVVESFMATTDARSGKIRNNIHDDRFIPAAAKLVDAIHAGGAKACGIIHHAGGVTTPSDIGRFPAAPSTVSVDLKGERLIGAIPRTMKTREIKEMVVKFGEGALRLKKAGFDIIMILAAHGYLFNQFLSPYHNIRTDEYGGSDENRMRFLLETVAEVRRQIGDTPLFVRLSCSENFRGGYEFDYILKVSKALEEAGVDSINYSNGNYHGFEYNIPSHHGERCLNVKYAQRAVKELRIPISVVGRITTPEECCDIIESGKSQMVWVGRQFLADTEWMKKAQRGEADSIRRCLGCNIGCIGRFFKNQHIGCAVNHKIGNEAFYETMLGIVPEKKKLLVVGGGAAGMEAARVAAGRGHTVTLIEQRTTLGGQLNAAGITPHKERCLELRDQMAASLEKAGVKIRLSTPYSQEVFLEEKPDAIALACGAVPRKPDFKGIDRDIVVYAEDFLLARNTNYHDAVILGGGETAVEIAEYLLTDGCENVTIISRSPDVIRGGEAHSKRQILLNVLGMSCDIRVCTNVLEIGDSWVLHDRQESYRFDGPERTKADVVIVASGYQGAHPVINAPVPTTVLADLDAGNIMESIAAGARYGMTLGVPADLLEND